MKKLLLSVIAFSFVVSLSFFNSAYAQTTVVVPNSLENTSGGSGIPFPFDCAQNGLATSMRFQQVYLGTQFPQAGLIDKISFRIANDVGASGFGPITIPNVQIELSTTQVQPSTLSSTFADNVGHNVKTVYSGDLTLSAPECNASYPQPCPFDIMINLQNPFFYRPQGGNLLLDVRIPQCVLTNYFDGVGLPPYPSVSSVDTYPSGNVDSNVGGDVQSGGGLTTQFVLEPRPPTNIPTMSEWGLIIMAGVLGIIGLTVIRKRKLTA